MKRAENWFLSVFAFSLVGSATSFFILFLPSERWWQSWIFATIVTVAIANIVSRNWYVESQFSSRITHTLSIALLLLLFSFRLYTHGLPYFYTNLFGTPYTIEATVSFLREERGRRNYDSCRYRLIMRVRNDISHSYICVDEDQYKRANRGHTYQLIGKESAFGQTISHYSKVNVAQNLVATPQPMPTYLERNRTLLFIFIPVYLFILVRKSDATKNKAAM